MRSKVINVVKIGGNVVNNPVALTAFLKSFAAMDGFKILVHGGGREATALSAALGIETTMIDGRRVTDAPTLDVVTMVYAGLVNKRIVAQLQSLDCDAVGLTGADAGVIRADRRPAKPVDYGFVGDIPESGVDDAVIAGMFHAGLTPVFCAITHDGYGQLLNCNADSVASAVACAASRIGTVKLTYCFEKPGVLADPSDDTSVIPHINPAGFGSLVAGGTVAGGMIPKIENALAAVARGVSVVAIKSADMLLDDDSGTKITG